MAYSRAISILEIDNAHADGMVTTKGIGRDWEAVQPRDEEKAGFSPDVGGQYGWEFGPQQYNAAQSQCEYIKAMRAIAPLGTWALGDMDDTLWAVDRGMWQEYWAANPGIKMLHFYDGRAGLIGLGASGIIASSGDYTPNLQLWLWRFPPRADETDPASVELWFEGDGTGPQYCLGFPEAGPTSTYYSGETGASGTYTQPYLMGKPNGEALWTLIDTSDAGGASSISSSRSEPRFQAIRIEQLAETLLVRVDQWDDPWVYSGEWESQAGNDVSFALTEGPLQVRVSGQTIMFAIAQLAYPSAAILYPRKHFFVPAGYNPTPSYHLISDTDPNTSISVVIDEDGPSHRRPKVTFESTDQKHRATLFCVQECREATIGGAVSDPATTQDNPYFKLMAASGRMDDTWKGGELTAEIEAYHGFELATIGANRKVSHRVSTNGGATFWTQFTGYTIAPERLVPPGVKSAIVTVHAADIVEARLSHKMMDWHASYEARPENEAIEEILNRAGVPPELMNVDTALTDSLPSSTTKGTRKLKFQPDIDVVSALNMIAEVRDRQWGVGCDGIIFWRERPEHTSGYYDWTLDAATAVPEHVAESIHSTRSVADLANWLRAMTGEGVDAAAKVLSDEASISDSTARTFLGDLWQRVVMRPDGDDVNALANALWSEIGTLSDIIRWPMWDEPWLAPGHYIRVLAPDADIPLGDIYVIIAKDWSTEEASGRYSQELEAKLIEAA